MVQKIKGIERCCTTIVDGAQEKESLTKSTNEIFYEGCVDRWERR